MEYDVIIIGMGISGISAAIYAKNSNLNVLLIEKETPGGLLNKINTINNYPGYSKITGPDLALNLFQSVLDLQIPYKITEVNNIVLEGNKKRVETTSGNFLANYIILATGRKNRKLGLENEEKLLGRGVSTCALCDGNLYKGKEVAVVGGGNSALEEALYLANIVNKVYLIHRRDSFRAEESLIRQVNNKENIEIIYNSNVTSIIEEENKVKEIVINEERHIEIAALFTYVGFIPNHDFIENLKITTPEGYIEVDKNQETKIKGIYAVGDCTKKEIYQLITAANDGVVAALHIIKNREK